MSFPSDSEIRDLTPEQRIRLIEMLWASFVDEPATLPFSDAQRREVRDRIAQHEAKPNAARSWSKVRAELDEE